MTPIEQVAERCALAFRQSWPDKPPWPSIKDVLNAAVAAHGEAMREPLFRYLLGDHIGLRRKAGENPQAEEYTQEFQEFRKIIEGEFQPATTDDESHVGTQLDKPTEGRWRYRLISVHAQGGLGRVWLARDEALNREVALKEILPDKSQHEEAYRRFVKEAQITGQLEHPNIVPVYELGDQPQDGGPFYSMRFVRGQTLRDAIAEYHQRRLDGKADPLQFRRLLGAFASVCQAIAYAHSRGVLHRDLKSANVVLGAFGEVIVLDWGLAKLAETADSEFSAVGISEEAKADATRAGAKFGTPSFMAPEQAEGRGDRIDDRTDVYGLGGILFEILTGRAPHKVAPKPGEDEAQRYKRLLSQIITGPTPRARMVEEVGSSVPLWMTQITGRGLPCSRSARTGFADHGRRAGEDEGEAWPRPPVYARLYGQSG